MITRMYSVRDNKVGVYHTPFFCDSDVNASRSLQMAVRDNKVQLSFFPEDFDLYFLGTFDDHDAVFNFLHKPAFVVAAVAFKKTSGGDNRVLPIDNPAQKILQEAASE
ncbi:MAG: nonstructural protein [Microvirus sp.]|nr:MAG: nonstructural protein [Microvirus sp.]